MGRAFFLLFLVAIVVIEAFPQKNETKDCGSNEEFTFCGSQCEPSCEEPEPKICTLACHIGCQCKEGYVRNSAMKCVPITDC